MYRVYRNPTGQHAFVPVGWLSSLFAVSCVQAQSGPGTHGTHGILKLSLEQMRSRKWVKKKQCPKQLSMLSVNFFPLS